MIAAGGVGGAAAELERPHEVRGTARRHGAGLVAQIPPGMALPAPGTYAALVGRDAGEALPAAGGALVLAGIVLGGVLPVGPVLGLAPGDESEPAPQPPPEVPAPEPPEEPDPEWPLEAGLLGLAAAAAAVRGQRP